MTQINPKQPMDNLRWPFLAESTKVDQVEENNNSCNLQQGLTSICHQYYNNSGRRPRPSPGLVSINPLVRLGIMQLKTAY